MQSHSTYFRVKLPLCIRGSCRGSRALLKSFKSSHFSNASAVNYAYFHSNCCQIKSLKSSGNKLCLKGRLRTCCCPRTRRFCSFARRARYSSCPPDTPCTPRPLNNSGGSSGRGFCAPSTAGGTPFNPSYRHTCAPPCTPRTRCP